MREFSQCVGLVGAITLISSSEAAAEGGSS